jgi:hypothetical protein
MKLLPLRLVMLLVLAACIVPLENVEHGPHWRFYHVGDVIVAFSVGVMIAIIKE